MRTKGKGKSNPNATPVEDEDGERRVQPQFGRISATVEKNAQILNKVNSGSRNKQVAEVCAARLSAHVQLPSDCQAILDYVNGILAGTERTETASGIINDAENLGANLTEEGNIEYALSGETGGENAENNGAKFTEEGNIEYTLSEETGGGNAENNSIPCSYTDLLMQGAAGAESAMFITTSRVQSLGTDSAYPEENGNSDGGIDENIEETEYEGIENCNPWDQSIFDTMNLETISDDQHSGIEKENDDGSDVDTE
ncbi:unnamed protein product [Urochloa humidicola]